MVEIKEISVKISKKKNLGNYENIHIEVFAGGTVDCSRDYLYEINVLEAGLRRELDQMLNEEA